MNFRKKWLVGKFFNPVENYKGPNETSKISFSFSLFEKLKTRMGILRTI